MKNKIERGQCYEYLNHVYMVDSDTNCKGVWILEDTLSKEHFLVHGKALLSWRRPFQNFG